MEMQAAQVIADAKQAGIYSEQALVNGQWLAMTRQLMVENPATTEIIATVADCEATLTPTLLRSATEAFAQWRHSTALDRAHLLNAWHQQVMAHQQPLAALLSLEQGKPLSEALAEIQYAADYISWFAHEALRLQGDWQHPSVAGRQLINLQEPVGVVLAITPWNFPAAMLTRKIAPAIAAGCAVIVKPSELTPLTALALGMLWQRCEPPQGLLQIVPTSEPEALCTALMQSPQLRKVSFTGSTAVGRKLMAQSAADLKRLSLELGGNAPFIVFADADLAAAVQGLVAAKFRNSGQTCVCVNRVLVAKQVEAAFLKKLIDAVAALTLGPAFVDAVRVGPLISTQALAKAQQLVAAALSDGATLAYRAPETPQLGHFMAPTILTGVTQQMAISQHEIFAPVVCLQSFDNEKDALLLANDMRAGLAAYLYGRDERRNFHVASQLRAGMVGINATAISDVRIPFGGVDAAGFGREGSAYGIAEYQQVKHLCWQLAPTQQP